MDRELSKDSCNNMPQNYPHSLTANYQHLIKSWLSKCRKKQQWSESVQTMTVDNAHG